jgi:hypothetical protein
MRRAWHVERVGKKKNVYIVLVENMKARDHLEDLGVKGKIILKWIFKAQEGRMRIVFMQFGIQTTVGLL